MSEVVYINANEFIETLKSQGLCIVSVKEFEANKEIIRRKLLRRKTITVKEIIDHRLLPLGSKAGVELWIKNQKIKPDEVIRESSGKKRTLILTSAIIRLGYAV